MEGGGAGRGRYLQKDLKTNVKKNVNKLFAILSGGRAQLAV